MVATRTRECGAVGPRTRSTTAAIGTRLIRSRFHVQRARTSRCMSTHPDVDHYVRQARDDTASGEPPSPSSSPAVTSGAGLPVVIAVAPDGASTHAAQCVPSEAEGMPEDETKPVRAPRKNPRPMHIPSGSRTVEAGAVPAWVGPTAVLWPPGGPLRALSSIGASPGPSARMDVAPPTSDTLSGKDGSVPSTRSGAEYLDAGGDLYTRAEDDGGLRDIDPDPMWPGAVPVYLMAQQALAAIIQPDQPCVSTGAARAAHEVLRDTSRVAVMTVGSAIVTTVHAAAFKITPDLCAIAARKTNLQAPPPPSTNVVANAPRGAAVREPDAPPAPADADAQHAPVRAAHSDVPVQPTTARTIPAPVS